MGVPGGRRQVLAVAVTAVVLLFAGCGPGASASADRPSGATAGPVAPPAGDPSAGDPSAGDPVTSAPPTGEGTIAPDGGGGGGGPALDLPRLPVGGSGSFVDTSQDLQCAPISWTAFGGAAGLDRGVAVEVVGYQFDTDHFVVPDGGCDQPSCVHYVFGSTDAATGCTVAIRTVRPQPAGTPTTSLFLIGKARCEHVGTTDCEQFISAVNQAATDDSTIDLVAPDPTVESPSDAPSESPTESPTDATPMATADASPTA